MVYRYAIGGNTISSEPPRAAPYGEHDTRATEEAWNKLFALGKVCRQLHQETRLLPYKLNVFNLSLGHEFDDFLRGLSDAKKKAITTVSVGFDSWVDPFFIEHDFYITLQLKDCTGLKTIISMVTLEKGLKEEVEEYAEWMGLKLAIEEDVSKMSKVDLNEDGIDGGLL